jgi:ABC-type cobalamin/Fe3+-siderophores transport system ATPase subunit
VVEFLGVRIKSLKLTDHPVLGDLELDFTIGSGDRVADNIIIAGENGCGKTTLLNVINDFFEFMRAYFESKSTIMPNYGIEIQLIKLPNYIEQDFGKSSIQIKIENKGIVINHELQKQETINRHFVLSLFRTIFLKSNFNINTQVFKTLPNRQSYISHNDKDNQTTEAQKIKELIMTSYIIDALCLKQLDKSLTLGEALKVNQSSLLNRLEKTFSLTLSLFPFNSSEWEVYVGLNKKFVKLEELSSGEKQMIFRGVYFLQALDSHKSLDGENKDTSIDNVICLIDEPENSLHPRWQKEILKSHKSLASNSFNIQELQILFSTHSPFIIHEANPQTDKVIVLQKDQDGKIIVAQDPLFESCDGEKLVEAAFYINFRKTNKPLVITEGKTDKQIIETAWSKLYPNAEMPFEIHDAGIYPDKINVTDGKQERKGGANHITSLLSYSLRFNEDRIIGLFDNDHEGNNVEMPKLKNNKFELKKTSNFSYCKYPDKDVFGLLLPCPDHRKNYVCEGAKAKKKLVIEHYFNDIILEKHKLKGEAYDENIFFINDGNKTKFAEEIIQTLPPEDFSSFKILFDALKHLLEPSGEQ